MTAERAVFIVNPASANGSTGRRWPEIAHRLATAGLAVEAHMSERPGHVVELARRAVEAGAGLVVAVGGDGTVSEAANGIAGSDRAHATELGVVPRGTGTDFVRTLGIPTDVDGAIATLRDGRARTIDLGRAWFRAWDGSERSALFANIASAGMSGAVAKRANETSKRLGGRASFLWATLAVFARWTNTEVTVAVDGERREARMLDVVVANCEYFAGGMHMCPDARPDDGLLDVLLIGDITKVDLVTTLPKIYRGTHLPHPKAESFRARSISVDAAAALPIELDGEQPGTTPVTFEVVPSALRVRVPS